MLTFLTQFSDSHIAFLVIQGCLGPGLLVAAIEDWVDFPIFSNEGLLSWTVSKTNTALFSKKNLMPFFNIIFGERGFKVTTIIRIITSLLMIILATKGILSPLLSWTQLVLLTYLLFRSPYGHDGGFQMYTVALLGLSIGSSFGTQSTIGMLSLWYIAIQVVLSYVLAGIVKIISPFWTKGYAMKGVFGTKIYGNEFVFNLVKNNRALGLFFCWSVILIETFYFAIFLLDFKTALLLVLGGFVFHLCTAVFMGLNDFFYSFSSTYPALIFCLLSASKIGVL